MISRAQIIRLCWIDVWFYLRFFWLFGTWCTVWLLSLLSMRILFRMQKVFSPLFILNFLCRFPFLRSLHSLFLVISYMSFFCRFIICYRQFILLIISIVSISSFDYSTILITACIIFRCYWFDFIYVIILITTMRSIDGIISRTYCWFLFMGLKLWLVVVLERIDLIK